MNILTDREGAVKGLTADERKGLPSASGLERIALCPGSWQLESQCPRDEGGADAASGTRIHAWLAGEEVELTLEELKVAEKCKEIADPMIEGSILVLREKRLWYVDSEGKQLFSGQGDIVAFEGSTALIIDYKTGRGAVSSAEKNIQLRALAVLVHKNYADRNIESVEVCIIQPLSKERTFVVSYDRSALEQAGRHIISILEAAQQQDAPLVPSEAACKYCRAKTICPALRGTITTPQIQDMNNAKTIMAASSAALAPAELGDLVARKVPLARMLCDALEKEAFSRLVVNPDSVPGLSLDTETPRVSDSVKLWERAWLAAHDKLTPAGRAKPGAGTEAKAACESAFAGMIESKLIERRSWTDKTKASETLKSALSPEQYREIAGKIIINQTNQ